MNADFKRDLVVCTVFSVFCIVIFLLIARSIWEHSASLKNWDQGKYSTVSVICTDFRLYQSNRERHWEFTFSDSTQTTLDYKAQFEFDAESYQLIMHRPLTYVYAEPSHMLMDIRDGDTSLLNVDYSRKNLQTARSSSLFISLIVSILPLSQIVLSGFVIHKHLKSNKRNIES